jgi:hypothetical protein
MSEHPEQPTERAAPTCKTCAHWYLQTCLNKRSEFYGIHTRPASRCESGILHALRTLEAQS